MSKITHDGFNPVWHRMLYSRTHMATVGVKGLIDRHTFLYQYRSLHANALSKPNLSTFVWREAKQWVLW